MDEYISREEAVKAFCEKCRGYYDGHCIHRVECDADVIQTVPSADVQPVKHGRWIKHRIDDPKSILHGAVKDTTCSVCGKSTPYTTEYCMHCGARMDGDSE